MSFWTKFTQKGISSCKQNKQSKDYKRLLFCVGNVNSTVVIKDFEDFKRSHYFEVMIKFRSKFQFQIPLQFYRTVEKVETCDGNGQKF